MIDHAIKLHNLGLRVIPTKADKRPTVNWTAYQKSQTLEDVKKIFRQPSYGMALLTGKGIEVIDIDCKYFLEHHDINQVFDLLYEAVGAETYSKLLITHTQSKGYHVIYKTTVSEGSQKLASRYTLDSEKKNEHDLTRVLIETRGEKGYIIAPPTKGYKFDSESIQFDNIPTLTDAQRNAIVTACRSYDELKETYNQTKAPTPIKVTGEGKSTIEAFNDSHTPIEFLESEGWQFKYQRGENLHYVRPGKTLREGIGAGYSESLQLVRIFTSSTQFECNKSYNAFQTYAVLFHGGDYSAACKELYDNGYGDRLNKRKDSHNEQVRQATTVKDKPADLKKDFEDCRIHTTVRYVQKPSTLFIQDDKKQKMIGLGGYGDIVNIYGARKSKKTGIAMAATSCFLKGGCGQSLKFSGSDDGKNVVHFDTEQSKYYAQRVGKEMKYQAGLPKELEPSNFYSFSIRQKSKIDRLNFIKHVLYNEISNVGTVLLDGIVDICRNYNDLEESSDLVTFFENASMSKQFLLLDIIHTARSTGDARGHLGGELLNKGTANLKVTAEKNSPFSTFEIDDKRGEWTDVTFDFYYNDEGHIDFY